MPDATGLELIAQELRDRDEDSVLGTVFFRDRAAVLVSPASVPATLETLRGKGYGFLASVHGVDYFPEEPRLGVHYELHRHGQGRPHLRPHARARRRPDGAVA